MGRDVRWYMCTKVHIGDIYRKVEIQSNNMRGQVDMCNFDEHVGSRFRNKIFKRWR